MAMITLAKTIFKKTSLRSIVTSYKFKYKFYQPKLCQAKFDQVTLKLS